MNQVKLFFATTSLAVCLVITNSCSQTTTPANSSAPLVFKATTLCSDDVKSLLQIPADTKCEMMKWNLTLFRDPKTSAPGEYKLIYEYGMAKQGTRDFMEGSKTTELKGKWTIGNGTKENAKAEIYTLEAGSSPVSLSFLRPDQNILHLLDQDKNLMIGNGAWSYTLNNVNPIPAPIVKFLLQPGPALRIEADSVTVGVFDGRTPCSKELLELNGISASGCQIIKCRLTLYQDSITHTPTTFQIYTVYVGKGDTRYSNTGKWKIFKGTKNDPEALVYVLEPDSGKPRSLVLLKADNNILFFLDENMNHMVGDTYTSFTLNRFKK